MKLDLNTNWVCRRDKSISDYGNTMKFGLQHPIFTFDYSNGDTSRIIDYLKNLIIRAENAGFDSFWTMDHFHQIPIVGKPEEPMLEAWTTISVLAGITTKIRLGTLVTGVLYRYPSVLQKLLPHWMFSVKEDYFWE
jgi:hypothetical protein